MDNKEPAPLNSGAQPAQASPAPSPATLQTLGERVQEFEAHLPSLNQALSMLASFVPGFAGYKSAEERRIADKQLRAVIGERLSKVKDRIDAVVEMLSRAGTLDGLSLLDQSARRLERVIDRMRFADYGYAAVFDRVQMGDAELARIYQYDAALMGELAKFDAAAADVEQSGSDMTRLRAALAKLDGLTAEFDRRFEGRKHLFDGLPTP
jgi:hypothetical protein